MKSRQFLSVIPLMLLASCAGPHPLVMTCSGLAGHVYTGDMKNSAGLVLDTVTISLNDTHPPGFKHNVMVVPPQQQPPNQPQYDAECVDGSPVVLNIYRPDTQPPMASRMSVWTIAAVIPQGYAFHLSDPGSNLFPAGASGDFTQTQ